MKNELLKSGFLLMFFCSANEAALASGGAAKLVPGLRQWATSKAARIIHGAKQIAKGGSKAVYDIPGSPRSVVVTLLEPNALKHIPPQFLDHAPSHLASELTEEIVTPIRSLQQLGIPTPQTQGHALLNDTQMGVIMERFDGTLYDALTSATLQAALWGHGRSLRRQYADILRRLNKARLVNTDLHSSNIGLRNVFSGSPEIILFDFDHRFVTNESLTEIYSSLRSHDQMIMSLIDVKSPANIARRTAKQFRENLGLDAFEKLGRRGLNVFGE